MADRELDPGRAARTTRSGRREPIPVPNFPGPLVTGICLIASPILAIVGTGLAIGIYSESGKTLAANMAAHHTRGVTGVNISITSIALGLFVVIFLAHAISRTHPRLGRAAGVLTLLGLMGPMFFEGIFWGASHIVDTPAHQSAAAALVDASNKVPTTMDNFSGPCLLIGFILLGVGAAKSGLLRRPRAWALGVTCLLPFGFISGYIVIATVAFVGFAIAVVPLGVRVLQERQHALAAQHVG